MTIETANHLVSDAEETLAFLTKVKDKVKSSVEATVLCLTAIGNIHLVSGNKKETKVHWLFLFIQ